LEFIKGIWERGSQEPKRNHMGSCPRDFIQIAPVAAEPLCARVRHEDVRESSVIDSGGGDLHERVCDRAHASKLQEERQELPDERQQGLQLREEM
jgi:hypothetical protein